MSKIVNGSVQPGSLYDNTLMDSPVEQLQQQTPQSSVFTQGLEETLQEVNAQQQGVPSQEPSPAMGFFEEGEFDQIAAEQDDPSRSTRQLAQSPNDEFFQAAIEREQQQSAEILPINQRLNDDRITSWDTSPVSAQASDGGLTERAAKLKNAINTGADLRQQSFEAVNPVMDFSAGTQIGKTIASIGAAQQDLNTGKLNIDNNFIRIMSAYAEDYFAQKTIGVKADREDPVAYAEAEATGDKPKPTMKMDTQFYKREDDPRKLGQTIAQEYQRLQGVPDDQIAPIADEAAARIGDYAKESYAYAMGDKILRENVKEAGTDKSGVRYTLSNDMLIELQASQPYRDQILPRKFVRPTKAPTRSGLIEDAQRFLTKDITGKLGRDVAGRITTKEIDEAIRNSGSIPNVVRPERMKILWATLLPALQGDPRNYQNDEILSLFADMNSFGPSKLQAYQATQKAIADKARRGMKTPEGYDPLLEIQQLKKNVAQNAFGIAMERHGANYFQYFMQAFNGRLTPQASLFNPTTSKAVRFVTANATPTLIKPASKMEQAAWQAYALVIGGDKTDALLPKERKQAMLNQAPQLERWGNILDEIMNNTMSDAEAEAIAEAIANGVPMNDPSFPKVKAMGLDPEAHSDLIKAIKDKGEDGLAYIDGLIDFAKFRKAMREGRTYASYLNPTIDGKTNGPASNGMQMGDEKIAFRTGVLRTEDNKYAVQDDEDIRDAMMGILRNQIQSGGLQGHYPNAGVEAVAMNVAFGVFQHRQLAKDITMTFGYGKDFKSFIPDIEDAITLLAEKDPTTFGMQLSVLEANGITRDVLAESLLNHYIPAVVEVMSPDGIQSRHLLWGMNFFHALADIPTELFGPTGLHLRLGGMAFESSTKVGTYSVGDLGNVTVRTYEGKPTAAAIKHRVDSKGRPVEDIGGKAHGGIIPAPIQAIDAATVVKTMSGRSWKKIKQATGGNPYVHQIYDAFKFDIATYAVAAEEVNNNWAKVSLEWSYLREADLAMERARQGITDFLARLPNRVEVGSVPMLYSLLEKSSVEEGTDLRIYPNLLNKIRKMTKYQDKEQTEQWARSVHDAVVSAANLQYFTMRKPQLSKEQVRAMFNTLWVKTNVHNRIKEMAAKTDAKKAILKKKIAKAVAEGNPIYQYYSH